MYPPPLGKLDRLGVGAKSPPLCMCGHVGTPRRENFKISLVRALTVTRLISSLTDESFFFPEDFLFDQRDAFSNSSFILGEDTSSFHLIPGNASSKKEKKKGKKMAIYPKI